MATGGERGYTPTILNHTKLSHVTFVHTHPHACTLMKLGFEQSWTYCAWKRMEKKWVLSYLNLDRKSMADKMED